MEVIALTLLISLALAGVFVSLFVWSTKFGRTPEQDSLMPLDEDHDRKKPKDRPENGRTAA